MLQPEVLGRAATVLAEDAEAVRVVDHQPRAVAVLALHDPRKIREIPLHREHAVDDDQLALVVARHAQLLLEVVHVVVAVLVGLAEAEAAAVDDAGVVERVEDRDVGAVEQAGEDAQVDLEAGREGERRLASHELREALLELDVDLERAVEQPRARAAGAVEREGGGGRRLHLGVVRQAQVVVRAQHHELAPLVEHDGILGRLDHPVVGIHARRAHRVGSDRRLGALLEYVHALASLELFDALALWGLFRRAGGSD